MNSVVGRKETVISATLYRRTIYSETKRQRQRYFCMSETCLLWNLNNSPECRGVLV